MAREVKMVARVAGVSQRRAESVKYQPIMCLSKTNDCRRYFDFDSGAGETGSGADGPAEETGGIAGAGPPVVAGPFGDAEPPTAEGGGTSSVSGGDESLLTPPSAADVAFKGEVDSGVSGKASDPRLDRITRIINITIQIRAVIIVILVKTSPAFVPNALDPPAPPKAPASPPPLPRWIKTRQIRKRELMTTNTFNRLVRNDTAKVLGIQEVGKSGAGPT